jgi:hypothetical protein
MSKAQLVVRCKIDVTKVEKAELYKGEKGTYLELVLFETEEGKYGDNGFVVQGLSKATRDREPDRKGAIIGNWRWTEKKAPTRSEASPTEAGVDAGALPF